MKTTYKLCSFIFCFIFCVACSKSDPVIEPLIPIPAPVQNLVGPGNRNWRLVEVYVNNVPQTLTATQMNFTKTYTIDPSGGNTGRFTIIEGYSGTWTFHLPGTLDEKINNNPSGNNLAIQYAVLKIKKDTLDIASFNSATNLTVREVYFGY